LDELGGCQQDLNFTLGRLHPPDVDQTVRLLEWQISQAAVGDAEHGGRGADPECHGDHGEQSEPGTPRQLSKAECQRHLFEFAPEFF
jgi:hypothetical protein